MFEKTFPYRAQSRLDLGVIAKATVEKGVKPGCMTPLSGVGEDRGMKPTPMTPTPAQAPTQPVNVPALPKK